MFPVISIQKLGPADPSGNLHYSIQVSVGGDAIHYPSSTAPGDEAVQIDWSDQFHSLLMAHGADFETMSRLMFDMHIGQPVAFPVEIGRAVKSSVLIA